MKMTPKLVLLVAILVSSFTSRAITNTAIAVSGTNIILSWPSYGYESYLVHYRQTLDTSNSWLALTNAYPANSTNRTTFTVYGARSAQQTGFYRVFHIPNFLANFSGYTFNGPTFIPVDYASPEAPVTYVDNTTVLINGQPTDDAMFMPYVISGVTNWGVGIYFDRFPNGTNTIQLLTTIRESDTLNDQTPYMVFSNAPAAINIGNSITFTNWSELILNNTYTFKAQSSVPNVNWEIDIYDAYDNFVNYQTGYSADGKISWHGI